MSGFTPGEWKWKWQPSSHSLDYPLETPDVLWDGEAGSEEGEPYDPQYGLVFDVLKGGNGRAVMFGMPANDSTAGLFVRREDAFLIAAAPEMYQALLDCESALSLLHHRGKSAVRTSEVDERIGRARRVLNKARGRV